MGYKICCGYSIVNEASILINDNLLCLYFTNLRKL